RERKRKMTGTGLTIRSRAIGVTAVLIALAGTAGAPAFGDVGNNPAAEGQIRQSADARIRRNVDEERGPVTNLPLPRYVSLKGNEGNARRGPSLSHRIDWVFRHAGMPLRVVAEFGHWRRVEDKDGAGGWVHASLRPGRRTAIGTGDRLAVLSRP